MLNMNLFEELGVESDPVYQKMENLQIGEAIEIDGIQIRRNKFYEIENDYEHKPFKTLINCYRHVSDIIVKQVTA
ncbi:MAG: hypothetical protein ABS935_16320 [Solibacillus sp.]|uniref:hypothetical protein n=1 Tax=Solibacillus sp. TaxID=1909654 RepID=UPI00331618EF